MPDVSKSKVARQRAVEVKDNVLDKVDDICYNISKMDDRDWENVVAGTVVAVIGGGLVVSAVSGARGNYKRGLFSLAFSATTTGIATLIFSN